MPIGEKFVRRTNFLDFDENNQLAPLNISNKLALLLFWNQHPALVKIASFSNRSMGEKFVRRTKFLDFNEKHQLASS